ncbi:AAA family ATPase [Spirillospora sp. NPDC048832]
MTADVPVTAPMTGGAPATGGAPTTGGAVPAGGAVPPGAAALPAWVRELDMALLTHPQILLTGNVRDQYPLPAEDGSGEIVMHSLQDVIMRVCRGHGYGALGEHSPLDQLMVLWPLSLTGEGQPACPESLREMSQADAARPGRGENPDAVRLSRIRQVLVDVVRWRGPAIGLVFPYAARVGRGDSEAGDLGRDLFTVAEALGHTAMPVRGPGVTPYNTIFWVTERQDHLAPEFGADSRRLRVIAIPEPLLGERERVAAYALRDVDPGAGPEQRAQAARRLAGITHGMQLVELMAIGRMAEHRGLPLERLEEAVRLYRVGVLDNPWADAALRAKIERGEKILNAQVIGQERAVARTLQIFQRSVTGLTGAQASSSPNRPRGVLFLSGPTGVGKTELAKGIAKLILGDDAEPIRFDMSEFAEEHARDRLIGAPPGYVGFDAGGELINAVRANPISVLLFDEIDKAHPRLYDLFLQILEDGRLTDGRGATVHFTETVLVFTSNLGVVTKTGDIERRLKYTDDPEKVRQALDRAFRTFFDETIRRPELRNRFGDNFIVMDFIQPEHVPRILNRALDSVVGRVADRHGARLTIGDEAFETLRFAARARLDHGGRGVLNAVEAALVNPLAAELFDRPPTPGEEITVLDMEPEGDTWRLKVDRCPA